MAVVMRKMTYSQVLVSVLTGIIVAAGGVVLAATLDVPKEDTTMTHAPDRMRTTLLFCSAIVVTLLLILDAKQVLAAAPANDVFTNPTLVPGLPFSDATDTTEATTDADDDQLNVSCGAPATDASVWYVFTPAADIGVVVDVSQSNYSAGVLVGVESQGNIETVACGPGGVFFFAAAGTTYYVLAIDDQDDGGGNGGNLAISFTEAPPPPTVEIMANATGTFNAQTGIATISGTFICRNGFSLEVFVEAEQHGVGRNATIRGFGSFGSFEPDTCDGTPHPWSAVVVPDSGMFKGGKALTVSFSFACGSIQCTDGFTEQTIQLKGGGGAKAAGADQLGGQLFLPLMSTRE